MKFIYPAVFTKTEDNTYEGYFPDLEGCTVKAGTLEDAIEQANEAARNWLEAELAEDDPLFPPVTEPEDLTLTKKETVRNICVTVRFYEGWDE